MYQGLLITHSITRWLVLAGLLFAIFRSVKGYFSNGSYTKLDNAARHWTATFGHIQLVVGMTLYTQSPIIQYFWTNKQEALQHFDITFFALVHMLLMFIAIILLTIGSSMAKRKNFSRDKFRTQLIWFTVALVVIFIAIPWPFSPLAQRPYYR